jgi:hypothetical protein
MAERAQATVEYAGIALLVLLLLAGGTAVARARLASHPAGDAAYLPLAARYAPRFAAERGDGERPVDFSRCRDPACAHGARPVLYVHGVRRGGFTYLEYWEYLPESRTAHTGIPAFDGYHRDDWEGLIVKLRPDGGIAGARASAHLGWNGRHPWWELRAGDWAPYPAPVYRASGSHAGALWSSPQRAAVRPGRHAALDEASLERPGGRHHRPVRLPRRVRALRPLVGPSVPALLTCHSGFAARGR